MARQRILGIVLAGGAGTAPRAADRGPGQAGRALRRPVPAGGFRAVQPGQRRLPAHLRAHPVQEPQPGPAYHHHLAAEQPAGQLRDAGPGPAATRAALANRLGGCDLPVAEPDLRRPARHRGGLRGRSRVPDGSDADDRPAPGLGRGGHGRGDPGPEEGGDRTSASCRPRRMATASRRSRKSRPTRRAARASRTRHWCPWATTCSTAMCWWRRCGRTRPTMAAGTAWAATSSRCWCGSAPRTSMTSCRTRFPARMRASWATGGTWGRSIPTSRRTWTCARVHPAFNLYNDQWPILTHVPSQPPAKFVHDDGDRVGRAINSVVSNGVIVSGGLVRSSVLSPGARVDSWARVDRAVILHDSRVGRHAVVENAILDKNVVVRGGCHGRGGQGA